MQRHSAVIARHRWDAGSIPTADSPGSETVDFGANGYNVITPQLWFHDLCAFICAARRTLLSHLSLRSQVTALLVTLAHQLLPRQVRTVTDLCTSKIPFSVCILLFLVDGPHLFVSG